LLDGESAEAVISRYPGFEEELGPLLSAATTLKSGPQPQLAQSSLAAMVARAQAQVESERDAVPGILPVSMASADGATNGPARAAAPRPTAPKTKESKPSLSARIAAWARLPRGVSGLPRAVALGLVLIVGLVIMGRFVGKPQTPVIPVPTISTQFSLDGTIEKMASNMWVVDGSVLYLEANTQIQGVPSIGSKAHIEGDIAVDNRRVARSIRITEGTAGTATVEIDNKPTQQPTLPAITGWATISPVVTSTITPVLIENAIPESTPLSIGAPVTASQATANPVTVASTVAPVPTDASPPTATKPPSALPSNTARVAPSRTSTPRPIATATAETAATATQVAQPGPASTPTVVSPPTVEPSNTPISGPQSTPTTEPTEVPTAEPTGIPTEEPTSTPRPQPTTTSNPDPTEPPEPEETGTPMPTSQPPNTPTTQPTVPPLPSPTGTEEPRETETAEPTHSSPPPTGTSLPTSTSQPQPTRTEDPGETHTPNPSEEPHETHTAEPTHAARP